MDPQLAQFVHVRIIIGIVTGLCVTRLLTGLARFVQHPVRDRIYLVHLAWAFFLLLAIMHFWWLELGLERIGVWTFEIYLFVICYAALFFFLGALLSRTAWTNIRGSPSISIPGRNGSTGCSPRCSSPTSSTAPSRAPITSTHSAPAIGWRRHRATWRGDGYAVVALERADARPRD